MNGRVTIGQQHSMIQLLHKSLQSIPKCDKVKDIGILIQRSFNGGFYSPIMAVNSFTDRAIKRNKMGGAENQGILGYSNAECAS